MSSDPIIDCPGLEVKVLGFQHTCQRENPGVKILTPRYVDLRATSLGLIKIWEGLERLLCGDSVQLKQPSVGLYDVPAAGIEAGDRSYTISCRYPDLRFIFLLTWDSRSAPVSSYLPFS